MTDYVNEIMAIIEYRLECAGISAENAKELKTDVECLVSAVDSYIEDYEEYPDDPYVYNGVSRSDFF